jgi:hypothetical protein
MMSDPYRQPAEMPKEEIPMSENLRIWKMVLICCTVLATAITGSCTFTSIDNNRTSLTKAQIESSETSRSAAQARYLEAKAKSDQAMFEQMSRSGK